MDVMDGLFVPNISIGIPVVASIRKVTQMPLDVHLMIVEPEKKIEWFAKSGADIITVHAEACRHLDRALSEIRKYGCKAGVSLNPATSPEVLEYVLDKTDLILVMSVNPGFGGQKFIDSQLEKITQVKKMIGQRAIEIEVDGGINKANAAKVISAGADVVVAGTAVFDGGKYKQNIEALRKA